MILITVMFFAAICTTVAEQGENKQSSESKHFVKYEARLVEDLLTNYSTGMRPVISSSEPARIDFAFKLNKLVILDTKEQVLIIDSFLLMAWKDPQLGWNKKDYNGTNVVNIAAGNLWTPDIVLYNTAENSGKSYHSFYTAPVVVNSEGRIMWMNAITLKASCDIDVTWFPFDSQNCSLKFGSWSFTSPRLKLFYLQKPNDKDGLMETGEMFVSNGVWDISSFSTSSGDVEYSCCEDKFSQITYEFILTRYPQFYLLYLILPCIAIVALALLSFLIPPDSGERIGFGVTVLLSFTVYLIVISDKLPEKSDKRPLLGLLYVSVFYILVLLFILSTITVRLSSYTHAPPQWLLNISRGLKLPKVKAFNKKFGGGKKITTIQVQEMGEKTADLRDENPAQSDSCKDDKESEEELYKKQWKQISSYLDKQCFKLVVLLLIVTPTSIVLTLEW